MRTTWPADWPERLRGKDCPMCAQGRPDEDEHGIRIHAGRYSDAYLQRATWQPGHTVVTWRGRHVAEPTELASRSATKRALVHAGFLLPPPLLDRQAGKQASLGSREV
jgi:hypothetical protein